MIAIVDYGMGNLRSVYKAFQYIGMEAAVTEKKKDLERAKAIVIPGVGTFYQAMENLRRKEMDQWILKEVYKGKPLLGICLGMQVLFQYGDEVKRCQGLGLLEGEIHKIPAVNKIPHMGWNQFNIRRTSQLLRGVEEGKDVYFVHSYYAKVRKEPIIMAVANYGIEIAAVVEWENVYGLQFHPEKSGEIGLKILRNFRQVIEC